MKRFCSRRYVIPIALCAVFILGITYFYLFTSMSAQEETAYLYIDEDDNVDSVCVKLSKLSNAHGMTAFRTLVRHSSYKENIHTGRYAIEPGNGALRVFRNLKGGMQSAVSLTIPSVRTVDKLAGAISKKLMMDSTALYKALTDEALCEKYGYDTLTIGCMFIPNTYDVYWDTTIESLLEKMSKESKKFWTFERQQKAQAMGLSPVQVITLASIVEEETANDAEKPMIAGMYYNRLKADMPLQADPTIKFALKNFELKRIYENMLSVKSPYNTYKNNGLPPGPIRIPSIVGIDAVLNHIRHKYLYMCAKEDFSGTHNFAETYQEHLKNAAKYTKALNERGIN